jgi:hypothetical protein
MDLYTQYFLSFMFLFLETAVITVNNNTLKAAKSYSLKYSVVQYFKRQSAKDINMLILIPLPVLATSPYYRGFKSPTSEK